MAAQTYGWLDIEFVTNKKIEGNGATEYHWPSDPSGGLKSDAGASVPVDPMQTFLPMESLRQDFDLLV
jgi:hypothetical protein